MKRRAPTDLVTAHQLVEARPWATRRWVRHQVNERRIPYYKSDPGRPNSTALISLSEFDELIATGRVEAQR